jgi:MFS family permease
MDHASDLAAQRLRLVFVVWAAGAVSQLLRASMGVLAPDFMREIGFGPEELGLLTGAFFFVFASVQLPGGYVLDRFGPRAIYTACLAFAASGCLVFALGDSVLVLLAGRVLMGLGCALIMISGFVLLSRWFESERFPQVSSTLISVSHTGTLIATLPLAAAAVWIGWRWAFLAIGGFVLVLIIVALRHVRDMPPGRTPPASGRETLIDGLKAFRAIYSSRAIILVMAVSLVVYPTVAAVVVLWSGPYLAHVYGLDAVARGNVVFIMALAGMVSPITYGWLSMRIGIRRVVFIGLGIGALTAAALAALEKPGLETTTLLLVIFGTCSGFGVQLAGVARLFFPPTMAARAMTSVNLAISGGTALMQMLTGFVVGAFPAADGIVPEIAYRTMFAVLGAATILGMIAFTGVKHIPSKPPEA